MAHSGAFHFATEDYREHSLGFPFTFTRYYRSALDYNGILGRNWDHEYDIRVVGEASKTSRSIPNGWCERFDPAEDSGGLTYYHGTGRVTRHAFESWEIRDVRWCDAALKALVVTYEQNPGESFVIQRYAMISGTLPPALKSPVFYRIQFSNGTRFLLNCHGYIVEIRDLNFNTMKFLYGLPRNPATGFDVLRTIIDTAGRRYELGYDAQIRMVSLSDWKGGIVTYHYDAHSRLEKVTLVPGDAGRPEVHYRYKAFDPNEPEALLREIVNPHEVAAAPVPVIAAGGLTGAAAPSPRPVSFLENVYDAQKRVREQRVGTPPGVMPKAGGRYTIAYPGANRRILTTRDKATVTYVLKSMSGTKVVRRIKLTDRVFSRGRIVPRKKLITTFTHDENFHVQSIAYPGKRTELFLHRNTNSVLPPVAADGELDSVNPPIARHNDLGRDALLLHRVTPAGGGRPMDTTYRYDFFANTVKRVEGPSGVMRVVFDHGRCSHPERNGNPIRIHYPPQRKPEGPDEPVVEEFDYERGKGGLLTYFKDADDVVTTFVLDDLGRVKVTTTGGATQERFFYDDRLNTITRYDDRNHRWLEEYDRRGNLRFLTDPLGHKQETTYDLNDRLHAKSMQRVDDPSPLTPLLTAQPVFTVAMEHDYDILGNRVALTQRVAAAGQHEEKRTWEWQFNGEEQLELERTPRAAAGREPGAQIRYLYNARGFRTHTTYGFGGTNPGTEEVVYDQDGLAALLIDPMLVQTVNGYDGFARLTSITLPSGTVVHREYSGAVLDREWMEGEIPVGAPRLPTSGGAPETRILRETRFVLDRRHRVISERMKVFDPEDRKKITTRVTAEARTDTWYTPGGRIEKIRNPRGDTTAIRYNSEGRIRKVEMPGNHTITYLYRGGLIREVTTRVVPDAGTVVMPAPTPIETHASMEFDELGRVVTDHRPDGVSMVFAYDSLGNRRAQQSPLGHTEYTYDYFGRLVRQTTNHVSNDFNDDLLSIRYDYDIDDNLLELRDDLGRRTSVTYTERSLIKTLSQPEKRTVTNTYRADGRPDTLAIQGRGHLVQYFYTPSGKVRMVLCRDGSKRSRQTFGYDGLDRVAWCFDSNGTQDRDYVQTYRTFDSLGRIRRERTVVPSLQYDNAVAYAYGGDHGTKTITYPGGPGSGDITYRHDESGNVNAVEELGGSTIMRRWHQGPGRVIESERRIFVNVPGSRPGGLRQTELRLRDAMHHDLSGRPSLRRLQITDEVNQPSPGATHAYANLIAFAGMSQAILYGNHGMIEDFVYNGHSTHNMYDGAGRLTGTVEEVGNDRVLVESERDGGNRLRKVTTTRFVGGQLTTEDTRNVEYDAASRTRGDYAGSLEATWKFDIRGRLEAANDYLRIGPLVRPTIATRSFLYDAADRLEGLDLWVPSGFGLLGQFDFYINYIYDAFGRRVARLEGDRSLPPDQRHKEIFLFDGKRCIEEYESPGVRIRRYIYDEFGHIVAYTYRDAATGTDRLSLPLTLVDGSPWLLLDRRFQLPALPTPPGANAPESEREAYYREQLPIVLERQVWRPFSSPKIVHYDYGSGQAVESVAAESFLPAQQGLRLHATERLQYDLVRFYESRLGEFITPDLLGSWADPRSLGHPRARAANNPVMFDDDGNVAWPLVVLGYLALTVGTTVVETVIERGIHGALGGETDFSWGGALARNFALGLATNWIPFTSVGKVGGRLGFSAARKLGAQSLMLGTAEMSGRYAATTAVRTGIEYAYEQTYGSGTGIMGVLLGNVGGDLVGGAVGSLLRRRGRRNYRAFLEDTREWMLDPSIAVGSERVLREQAGTLMLRSSARRGVRYESGLFETKHGTVVRRGDADNVSFLGHNHPDTLRHVAHYHPPGSANLRSRLPAPRDIELAGWDGRTNYIVARRQLDGSTSPVRTAWTYRGNGSGSEIIRVMPEMIDDFERVTKIMHQHGLGRREGNAFVFNRLEDYEELFFRYGGEWPDFL